MVRLFVVVVFVVVVSLLIKEGKNGNTIPIMTVFWETVPDVGTEV